MSKRQEGTYCRRWGCHPYQHWCQGLWWDQHPSDHLEQTQTEWKGGGGCFNKPIALNVHILPQNLHSDLSHRLLSFIFSHILVCVCVWWQAKKKPRWQERVCASVYKGTRHSSFFMLTVCLGWLGWVCVGGCGQRGRASASKKNDTFLFLNQQCSGCGQAEHGAGPKLIFSQPSCTGRLIASGEHDY